MESGFFVFGEVCGVIGELMVRIEMEGRFIFAWVISNTLDETLSSEGL